MIFLNEMADALGIELLKWKNDQLNKIKTCIRGDV